jgi:hypothetical protein
MIGDEFSSRMNHDFLRAIESGDDKVRDILPAPLFNKSFGAGLLWFGRGFR